MRPDMRNDYDADEETIERGEEGGLRWMTVGIVMLVVAGFFALAFYAYRSGSNPPVETLETIHADAGPVKDKPKDPGGMNIPYQDMSVYNVISGERKDDKQVEQLLPDPEEPIAKAPAVAPQKPSTETFIKPEPGASATPSPQTTEATTVPTAPTQPIPQPAPATSAATVPAPVAAPAAEAPNRFMEKAASEIKPVPAKPSTAAPSTAGTPAAPKPAAARGSIQVQLAALKSVPEAEKTWSQVKSRFPAPLEGKSHNIVKAELPSGTFYRLRVGGFTSESAKKLCSDLAARKQPCMIVR